MAEWFKAAVLKTARGFTLPRGFESHPFRQEPSDHCLPMSSSSPAYAHNNGILSTPVLYMSAQVCHYRHEEYGQEHGLWAGKFTGSRLRV